MTLEEYAAKILSDNGCDQYTYGDESAKHIMDDLKKAYPDGMPEYNYLEVANAILAMSRPRPIVRSPFLMCWSNEHSCDAVECESFGQAKCDAEDTLLNWMAEEWSSWQNGEPTEEQVDSFNHMIETCWVEVQQYNPETDEYETVWEPSYEDEAALGWVEIEYRKREEEPK